MLGLSVLCYSSECSGENMFPEKPRMRKRLTVFSVCCVLIAVLIFLFAYTLYHHMTPDGIFTSEWCAEPGKPLVTELFADLGVLFLFGGLAGLLARLVFFAGRAEKK